MSVLTGSGVFLVVFPFSEAMSVPKILYGSVSIFGGHRAFVEKSISCHSLMGRHGQPVDSLPFLHQQFAILKTFSCHWQQ